MNSQIASCSLLILVSYLMGYLTLYFKERVKNRAYLHDLKRLENEKQLISKEYELEIAKRKYKYESKRHQYEKYFKLIDEMTAKSIDQIKDDLLPIISDYTKGYLGAHGNEEQITMALVNFSSGINKLMIDTNSNLIRLRSETSAIRIIASSRTIELLNQFDKLYDLSFDVASKIVNELSTAILKNDFDEISLVEMEYRKITERIQRTKEIMIEQIRIELDEI